MAAVERVVNLISGQKFLSLAVVYEGSPWCANINYVVRSLDPVELIFYSSNRAVHSQAIMANGGQAAGSLFSMDDDGDVVDGMQFTGCAAEIPPADLATVHHFYYTKNFPDQQVRDQWMIPMARFQEPYEQRFYSLKLERIWLIDLAGWEHDKVDRRIPVKMSNPISTQAV